MRALVIGSEGNIGTPLVKKLKELGHEVLEVDIRPGWTDTYMMADINNPLDMLPAFDWGPDVVFFLAAMVSRVTCEQAESLSIATNLGGVQNVLSLCKRANAKCIYFSTSEVYGPDCEVMDEEDTEPMPNNRYGMSKLLGEKLVEYEVKHHGLKAVTLRPFMMYDENEDLGDHRSAMIRFAWRLATGQQIEVHRGSARGWLHADDAIRAIIRAAELDIDYQIINIGHPDNRGIDELAELIQKTLGVSEALITYRDLPERMTLNKNPSLNKMASVLGVTPEVDFEEGVQRVCNRVVERLKAVTYMPDLRTMEEAE